MLYRANQAIALRCIGQDLQLRNIDLFEIRKRADDFSVEFVEPEPPCTTIIRLSYSAARIEILDREGEARRGRSVPDRFRFDTVPETLRAVGHYTDSRGLALRRISNAAPEDAAIDLEYQTRTGDVVSENLRRSDLHEIAVQMYKRRTRVPDAVSMLTRRKSS